MLTRKAFTSLLPRFSSSGRAFSTTAKQNATSSAQVSMHTEQDSHHRAVDNRAFKILRYNPAVDSKPYMQEFIIDVNDCAPMMLDVLFKIKDEQDPTLSFRRSCREGICGSCAMNIEGKNGLACLTPIPKQADPVEIVPLPNMYVVRDLIPDMSNFYNMYKFIDPWLQRKSQPPTNPDGSPSEILQSEADRAKLDGMYECILCACCTTSCPSFWWNPETFLGPAALLQAYRWVVDSRDEQTKERLAMLNDTMKLYRCHGILNCTSCCPKGLNPAGAIAKIKALIEANYDDGWKQLKADQIRSKAKTRLERELQVTQPSA